MPSSASVASSTANPSAVTVPLVAANTADASHFPTTSSAAEGQLKIRGNSERRSRSPAKLSVATAMPPEKTATRTKTDAMTAPICPPIGTLVAITATIAGPINV